MDVSVCETSGKFRCQCDFSGGRDEGVHPELELRSEFEDAWDGDTVKEGSWCI